MTTSTTKARPATSRSRAAERARREPPRPSAAALLATAAAGVGVLVATGLARTGRPPAAPLDRLVRRGFRARWPDRVPKDAWWLGGRRHTRGHAVSEAIGGLTGELATIGAGAAAALAVARRRGPRPALPVVAAVPLGLAAHAAVKYSVRRPRPLTARITGKHTPSFPSGHAARGAAAAGILGYVGVREGVVPAAAALALGTALAVGGGGSRVYVGRHWGTDALGGWGLGVAAAAVCALWYDRERATQR